MLPISIPMVSGGSRRAYEREILCPTIADDGLIIIIDPVLSVVCDGGGVRCGMRVETGVQDL